jgi:hypothetical protein
VSRSSIVLALLAAACAPRATAPRGGNPAHAATVVVPLPRAAAAKPTDAGAAPADAGPRTSELADGATKTIQAALSVSAVGRFSFGDGGVTFTGSVDASASPSKPSPDLVVRSALLVPSKNGRRLMLFEAAVGCAHRFGTGARHVDVGIDWRRGAKDHFASVSIINGHTENYEGRIEVLAAPTAPGSIGKIRVTRTHGGNVLGGVVAVHVCQ